MSNSDSGQDLPEPSMALAEELVERINASLPRSVEAASFGTPSKLPFKVLSLRELLFHRLAELGSGAVETYRSDKGVPGVLLTRACFETMSVLYALDCLVRCAVDKKNVSSIDEALMRMLFGGRSERAPEQAINVLTHLDRMDRKFSGLRQWYDQLSEYAHPNYPGLMGVYGTMDREHSRLDLGANQDASELRDRFGVPALCACLEVTIGLYDSMVAPLKEFCDICYDEF